MEVNRYAILVFVFLNLVLLTNAAPPKETNTTKVTSGQNSKLTCEQQATVADNCFKELSFYNGNMPRNLEELNHRYCKQMPQLLACVSSTRRCFHNFQRQVLDIAVRAGKRFFGGMCKTQQARTSLIRDLSCIADNETYIGQRYATEVALAFDMSIKLPTDQQIPAICCMYYFMVDRSQKLVDKLCQAKSVKVDSREHFYGRQLSTLMSDGVDLICSNKYNNLKVCDTNLADTYRKLVEAVNAKDIPNLEYSPLKAALGFIHSLE